MSGVLFPFADFWWLYLAFACVVGVLLAIDLTLHRKAQSIPPRQALAWMGVWVGAALAFNLGLYIYLAGRYPAETARRVSLEFLAGYVVEESLSVDNMFVFALIFRHFAIPAKDQHRALFYGVLGAMVFRGIFIAIGTALMRFEWVLMVFGAFLVITGVRMAFAGEKQVDPEKSWVMRWRGRLSPLIVVVLLLESTDILFAVDSVPAVFAVTREPFIVYTSNVFAILGLRSMYFLLAGALERFHLLRYGLAAVLVFVGLKMSLLDHWFGGRFPIGWSLGIIAALLAAAMGASLATAGRARRTA